MVLLTQVEASNARFATAIPSPLVAVFVGATSGIGEAALKEFAHSAAKPRIYYVGRSQEAGDRLQKELTALNSNGEYIFVKTDASLLKNVDTVCKDIKAKETTINVLFLSQGSLNMTDVTSEGLKYTLSLSVYSRTRFVVNLLPLLQRATSLRRVVTVLAGGKEGKVFADDFEMDRVPMSAGRGHMCGMITMGFEVLAKKAPEVSFIHGYPGGVKTNLIRPDEGFRMQVIKYVFKFLMLFWHILPLPEVGHRHTFLCSSAMYPPARVDGAAGVPLDSDLRVARGVDGKPGSGVYCIDWDGESAPPEAEEIIAQYTKDGLVEKLWDHTEDLFKRITGSVAI